MFKLGFERILKQKKIKENNRFVKAQKAADMLKAEKQKELERQAKLAVEEKMPKSVQI
jgi:hypothetical protein